MEFSRQEYWSGLPFPSPIGMLWHPCFPQAGKGAEIDECLSHTKCLLLLLLLSQFSCVQLCATHRRQPTRLPYPWDSPGKNTGVGCHFLLQCTKVKSESEVAQLCPTLRDPMDCSLPGSSIHGIFQAKEYWSGVPLPSLTVFTDPELSLTRAVWGGGHWSHPAGEEGRTQRSYESCPSLPVSGEQSVFQGCLREPSCVCMCACVCECERERTDWSLTASAELGPLECGVTCPIEGDGASLD